jgi:hypothetical protein
MWQKDMKYHIKPKQAKEISEEQFYSLFNEIVKRDDWANYHHKKVTIGKMIDFLDGVNVYKGLTNQWYVTCYGEEYSGKELTDALWEAVKDSL